MAVYLKLPGGTVHSVSEEDWEKYHSVVVEGGRRVPATPGVTELTEAQARKIHPALFGQSDPRVLAELSMKEIAEAKAKREYLASLGVFDDNNSDAE